MEIKTFQAGYVSQSFSNKTSSNLSSPAIFTDGIFIVLPVDTGVCTML